MIYKAIGNKFHGKPVRIEPLKNSIMPKNNEKVKKDFTIFLHLKIIKHKVKHP